MSFENETVVACVADFPEHNPNNDHVAREDECGRPTYTHTLPERVFYCIGHCLGDDVEGYVRARTREEAARFMILYAAPGYRGKNLYVKGDGHWPDQRYIDGVMREDFEIEDGIGPISGYSWIRVFSPQRE